MKYIAPINNEEFARFYNGDYEDQLTAIYSYKKRVGSHLSLERLWSLFNSACREFIAI